MPYKLENAKILIVDDMKPMLALTSSILKIFGFTDVSTADNGAEAFDLVCRKDPDLIITDWMMKPMDGLIFTQKIRRSTEAPNPYVPVIMMTGFSSRLRVEKARDCGITEFLVKPFSSRDLYARVYQIIEKPRQFVDAESFFGPDRRRRRGEDYTGSRRRDGDDYLVTVPDSDDPDAAADILKKLKKEARNVSE